MSEGSKVFTVMVVGDNPDELMSKYDINLKVDKYRKYRYLDAEKIRNKSIKLIEEILANKDNLNLGKFQLDFFTEKLKEIKEMSDFEYYQEITYGLTYDENGDAWSDENQNGKWLTCKIGDFLSVPLILKNGEQTHQAINKDIVWDDIHMRDSELYDITWDLVHGYREPINEQEKKIFENMKNMKNYFSNFKTKDDYVIHNCAYWNFAYLDKNGWIDMDSCDDSTKWISQYFDTFVSKLSPTDKVTIYECTKEK